MPSTASLGTVTCATTVLAAAHHLDQQPTRRWATSARRPSRSTTTAIFVSKLTDVLTTGVGNLVDADLAKESARLQALQVQQQLGAQALSIANQAPQIILSLFKGG